MGRSKKPFWAKDYKKAAYNRAYYQKRKAQDKLTSIGVVLALGLVGYGWLTQGHNATPQNRTPSTQQSHAATLDALAPTPAQSRFWPDFNCSADHSKDSIATMLCQNSEAAKHELIFDQTYYALRQLVGKAGWKALKQEVIADDDALKECIVPFTPEGELPDADPDCYIKKMDQITEKYKTRLSGAALEEASRDIIQHILIQQKLLDAGYPKSAKSADGVYGEATRIGILEWQKKNNVSQTGFISDDEARFILNGDKSGLEWKDAINSKAGQQPSDTSAPLNQTREESRSTTSNDSGSSVGLIIFLLVPILLGGFVAVVRSQRKRDYEEGRARVMKELNLQKRNLQISRAQKITVDAYGTANSENWILELQYFLKTRIVPIINSQTSNKKIRDRLLNEATYKAEEMASEPLPVDISSPAYRSDPSVFDPRMNPFDYELHCALLLRADGWDAEATQKSGDQGADVIAQKMGIKIVVQCKLYTGTVGNDAVQQAFTAQTFQGAQAALVVTNSEFSTSARQASATTGVYLIHHTQLVDTAGQILRRLTLSAP
ncbi:restriction endonuclease [Acetobacter senegalensis]|uniref:restriction endonuclease n=1 Tax=Acetobacter senegalensis TaxID=446692 RepID=UPI001EDC8581|nr:restriction endonuclease [Acetobacter senegalensis]MCG4256930.1 restriction endonuclease [Acetobacter senegalensis]MCG4266932.1 restriction endonuclease [Acetobacter senegalensis]MCG4273891.1 restriction endonuclease [Acetobacter senegalensis]